MKTRTKHRPSRIVVSFELALVGLASMVGSACSEGEPPVGTIDAGGAGGSGGSGGGMVCEPGTTEPCYGGPPGTADVGVCRSGTRTCLPSGLAFDVCEGEVFPSPEDCTTPEDEACDGSGPEECSALGFGWAKSFGSSGNHDVLDVAIDPSTGDLVIVGRLGGTADFGGGALVSAGGDDIYVARLGPLGEHRWSKRFGDALGQTARSVAIDANGRIYVGGDVTGVVDFGQGPLVSAGGTDALLMALDPEGTVLWAKLFGSADDQRVDRVVVAKTGAIVVGGRFRNAIGLGGPTLVSNGNDDVFVAVLDADGGHVDSTRYGGFNTELLGDLVVDDEGSIIVTGSFQNTIDFGPNTGGPFSSFGSFDAFVAKLSASGLGIWAKAFGNNTSQNGLSIAVAPGGDVFVAGETGGPVAIGNEFFTPAARGLYLARMSGTSGDVTWAEMLGGPMSNLFGISLGVDAKTSDVIAAGYFDDSIDFGGGAWTSAGGTDVFLTRLSADGIFVSGRSFGGLSNEGALALVVSPQGEPIVGGAYYGVLDLGGGPLPIPKPQESKAFLARLLP